MLKKLAADVRCAPFYASSGTCSKYNLIHVHVGNCYRRDRAVHSFQLAHKFKFRSRMKSTYLSFPSTDSIFPPPSHAVASKEQKKKPGVVVSDCRIEVGFSVRGPNIHDQPWIFKVLGTTCMDI